MYCAVSDLGVCPGVEFKTSNNPINYKGLKIVKSGSKLLDDVLDFQVIRMLASTAELQSGVRRGKVQYVSDMARGAYDNKVLDFLETSAVNPLEMFINLGSGVALVRS